MTKHIKLRVVKENKIVERENIHFNGNDFKQFFGHTESWNHRSVESQTDGQTDVEFNIVF